VRFTIERIRTTILIAGVLLVAALGVLLTIGHWKSPFSRRDLPKKLGIDIQQEANGFTQATFNAGHAKYKLTASKVEQLKDNRFRLHAVRIEMYGPDGAGTDRIEGSDFEYDQKAGIAKAAGPVEITLDRPPQSQSSTSNNTSSRENHAAATPDQSSLRQIHVKTVGLTFDQNSGVATSANHVEFDLPQASGSAMSASYDSQHGQLVLAGAVELNVRRGPNPVEIQAQHAVCDRDASKCSLTAATARYRDGDAQAGQSQILFREDGTVDELEAANGLVLNTKNRGRVAAPTGQLSFDAKNEPTHGHLEGGVILDSDQGGRTFHGSAPMADLQFSSAGLLRSVHLERNVTFATDEQTGDASAPVRVHRTWASPVADVALRDVGAGRVALDSVQGTGGVVVSSDSRRGNAAPARARMTADEMKGSFGADSALTAMTGTGHATLDQTSESGTRQTAGGDRVEAQFTGQHAIANGGLPSHPAQPRAQPETGAAQIDRASVVGHVVLTQQAAASPGSVPPAALRATAQRADYEGAGEWLHLIGTPHVENGEIALDAEKVDLARASGDVFAHGSVKATWFGKQGAALGAQGPAHIVASEAQMHQASGEAAFRGNARLWQQANSISAPVIVLDRTRQTLSAQTANPADPVRVVLLSAANMQPSRAGKAGSPSVVRVRGGDLKYSEAERKAVMHGGVLAGVVAETGDATTQAQEVDLLLLSPGNHSGKDGGSAQVDRMTASGNVSIEADGRRGTGSRLDYSSERDEYVLTGTAANPPRLTDPARGTVTGESLIFNSRDDSVNVEGGQRATTTETTAPKRQ
jgi:lipopolysaccharide export system protein LptA